MNSRLCDRNQRRSLLLQRLIKTNRCATGAGTRGERSRGVVYKRVDMDENSSVDLLEDWKMHSRRSLVVKCSKNVEFAIL